MISNGQRTIRLAISADTVRDLIASHLYAMTVVNDNEDVIKLKFNPEALDNFTIIPLEVTIEKREVIKVIHDG